VSVALGRINAEPLEHVDANLFLPRIDGMALESRNELVSADPPAAQADVDVPGLMIDA
jgi:hypothetical protein